MKRALLAIALAAAAMAFLGAAPALAQCHGGTMTYADIDAVRYMRTACFGRCPIDEVLFSRQGNYYLGRNYVAKAGTYKNEDGGALKRVIHVLEQSHYFTLVVPRPAVIVTDLPHSIIAVQRCGVTKMLNWNHMAESAQLEALFKRLDGVRDSMTWHKSSSSRDEPLPRLAPIL